MDAQIALDFRPGFGRVWWASSDEWTAVLEELSPFLSAFADLVDLLASDPILSELAAKKRPTKAAESYSRRGWLGKGRSLRGRGSLGGRRQSGPGQTNETEKDGRSRSRRPDFSIRTSGMGPLQASSCSLCSAPR